MANLVLYRDLLQHLIEFAGGNNPAASNYKLLQAVQQGYRTLVNETAWQYLYAPYMLTFNAPYVTGTAAYTNSTQQMTLSGGTWPAWAQYGHIRIGAAFYDVASRTSDSVLQMNPIYNPGQDIPSGTAYTLYESGYALPTDFRAMLNPEAESSWWNMKYVPPEQWQTVERRLGFGGVPSEWTVLGDPHVLGGLALYVYPYPTVANTLAFIYQRGARTLRISGFGAADYGGAAPNGAVSVSISGATVTGTNTAFNQGHVGCILRLSANGTIPDGPSGLNPYLEEVQVSAVSSTTSLTLASAPTNSYSGAGFVLSDPIEIPLTMRDALYRSIEYQEAIVTKNTTQIPLRRELYVEAANKAIGADVPHLSPDTPVAGQGYGSMMRGLVGGYTVTL